MTTPTPIEQIDEAAKALSEARNMLFAAVSTLQGYLEAAKEDAMPTIKRRIMVATQCWNELDGLIKANPNVFVKPKTLALHGIKLGYAKDKDKLLIPDPAATIKAIKKHMPEMAGVLIITEETPAASAIAALSNADIKRLHCAIQTGADRVVIRPAEGAVDALVKSLVKEQAGVVEQAAEGVV